MAPPAYAFNVAAATAVIGYDLLSGQPVRTSDVDRVITGLGIMGSAAALDTVADLLEGFDRQITVQNRTTGAPNMDDVLPTVVEIPAGSPITLPVVDAPATNPIAGIIVIEDVEG